MAPDCTAAPSEELRAGIDLFNRGAYYDCHEVLEDLWAGDRSPARDLYQGILQVAVALHHLENGNYTGALLLLRKGPQLLRQAAPVCLGVDTAALAAAADAVRAALEACGPAAMDRVPRALFPRIPLPDGT